MSTTVAARNSAREIDPAVFAKSDELKQLAATLDGPITLQRIREAYSNAPTDQRKAWEQLFNVAKASRAQQADEGQNFSPLATRAGKAKTPGELFSERVATELDNRIVGQANAKGIFVRALRSSPPGRARRPTVVAVTGPSGVGKTELAKAAASALHPELKDVEPVVLEGAWFKNIADVAILEGAPPGYAGYGDTGKVAPLSKENINTKFQGKKPIVIVIDEIDDIDESVRSQFWSKWNKAFDEGYLVLKNGDKVDLAGALIVITSNAGLKTVGALKGEAAAQHYNRELEVCIGEPKIVNRIGRGNIVPCSPLSLDELEAVVDTRFIAPLVKESTEQERVERGVDVTLNVDSEALKLIRDLTHSDTAGARTARELVDKIISPMVSEAFQRANDDDRLRLSVKPDFSTVERNRLIGQFTTINGLPSSLSVESSPFRIEVKTAVPTFSPYAGTIPMSPLAAPIHHASGAFAGDGFMLFNRGEIDSPNELLLVEDGPTPATDRTRSIALPPRFASANVAMNAAVLSDKEMLITGVSVDAGSDEPWHGATIYNHATKKFTDVAPPPLALTGSTLAAVGDGVLLTGGRPVYFDGEYWSVHVASDGVSYDSSANPDNGVASQDQSWFYRRSVNTWEPIDTPLQTARTGMAHATVGDKVFLFGGEETRRHANGTVYTAESKAIDVFDSAAKTITPSAQQLTVGVAHARAVVGDGAIKLLGGMEFINAGSHASPKASIIDVPLDTAGLIDLKRTIKVRPGILPAEAANSAVIARGPGHIVGPFVDEDGELVFTEMKDAAT